MGLFDMGRNGSTGYKEPLIPGCKLDPDSSNPNRSVITCNPVKVFEGKTFGLREGEEFKVIAEKDGKGRIQFTTINDGGLPVAAINDMITYLKGKLK